MRGRVSWKERARNAITGASPCVPLIKHASPQKVKSESGSEPALVIIDHRSWFTLFTLFTKDANKE